MSAKQKDSGLNGHETCCLVSSNNIECYFNDSFYFSFFSNKTMDYPFFDKLKKGEIKHEELYNYSFCLKKSR